MDGITIVEQCNNSVDSDCLNVTAIATEYDFLMTYS